MTGATFGGPSATAGASFGGVGATTGAAASAASKNNPNLGPAFGGFGVSMGASAFGSNQQSRQNVTGTSFGRDSNLGFNSS